MSKNKFAKKQLEKHGWTEGSGLGKHESGIKDAIKVKLKHDTAGVGHNKGDEFTFQWWDHVFNKAASSISVKASEEGVAVEKVSEVDPVSNKKPTTYAKKSMLYGQFVKGATLSNGEEDHIREGVESSDEETDKCKMNRLMDDEMLEKCGGMTAHKAARHGHKLSAKMARVLEQEKIELEKLKKMKLERKRTISENTLEEENIESEKSKKKRKKEKKKKRKEEKLKKIIENVNNLEKTPEEMFLIDKYHDAVKENCMETEDMGDKDKGDCNEPKEKKSKKKKKNKDKS